MDRKYDLIIFDWDGTLVDSQAHIIHCMSRAIADERLPVPAEDDIRHIIGLSLPRAISSLLTDIGDPQVQRIADHYRRHFFDPAHEGSKLFPGAKQIVEQLHADGYYLAVATGKGRRGLDMALTSMQLASYFHITRCADETCSKPDPQMLQEILTDLDLSSERAIMIGDTSYDIEMANNIRMDSIAVTYGMHDPEHLQASAPTYFVDDLQQLHSLLKRNM